MAAKLAQDAGLDRLLEIRSSNLVPIDQPLVLIAPRLARSGGSLLLQLLDSHPQLHVRPHELKFGVGETWPALHVDAGPQEMLQQLRDPQIDRAFEDGYYYKDRPARKLGYETEGFPMLLSPVFMGQIFLAHLEQEPARKPRDAFDAYFTAYFNGWLDNQNLYGGERRWVVAFRAKLGIPENVDAFFEDYPDGRHIGLVREAKGWIASRLKLRDGSSADISAALDLWMGAVDARLALKERLGEQMALISFENLVEETEGIMRGLARWLSIDYDARLLQPTFNRIPIKANSSFPTSRHGVLPETLEHWRGVLSRSDAELIDRTTADLYERARAAASF